MKFSIIEFVIGIWFGIMIVGMISHFVPDSNYNIVHNAKTKCQEFLPRNQNCIITAIPETK